MSAKISWFFLETRAKRYGDLGNLVSDEQIRSGVPGPARPQRLRRLAARVAAPAIGVLALALVVAVVPLRDRCSGPTPDTCVPGLLSVLAHARLGLLALLALLTVGGTLLATLRWYSVLALSGFRRSFAWTWRTVLAAQAGALLLPGGIGGDAVRLGFVLGARRSSEDGGAKEAATSTLAATVLLDRSLGLVSLASLSGALALVFGGGDVETRRLLAILFALPVAFFAGIAVARSLAFARLPLFRTRLGAKLVPVLEYLRQRGAIAALARGLGASLLFTGLQLAVLRGIVLSLGPAGAVVTSERWVFLGSAMGLLVSGLPGLPGGWGTADAAYVFFLARAGLPPQISLAVCLLNRIFYYGVAIVGACLLLVSRAARRGT